MTHISELLTRAVFGAKWRGWERESDVHVCMNVYADVYQCVDICMCECVYVCVCVHMYVCVHVPTGTHSCTCMCAGQVLQDAVLESRASTWQVSDRRVTTEGRPTLNSAWAARELLEGAGCELQKPGAGLPCWGSLPPALGGQAPPPLGALSLSSCRRKSGPRQDMEPDGMGVSSLVFIGLVDLKGCLWILFPQTAVLSGPVCLGFSQPLHAGGR